MNKKNCLLPCWRKEETFRRRTRTQKHTNKNFRMPSSKRSCTTWKSCQPYSLNKQESKHVLQKETEKKFGNVLGFRIVFVSATNACLKEDVKFIVTGVRLRNKCESLMRNEPITSEHRSAALPPNYRPYTRFISDSSLLYY